MLVFKERVRLSRLFARWARENDVRASGETMLAWLQAHGLLNEEAARKIAKSGVTKDAILSALKRMKVETGSFVCMGCGLEHSCGTKGCRILREAAELIEERERELEAAMAQLKDAQEACSTCVYGKSPLPCAEDPDPVGLCDTCERDCECRYCEDHSKWEWDGGWGE